MQMINKAAQVVGVPPRITSSQFRDILEAVSSPALISAEDAYRAIVKEGVDPAFCMAVFAIESAYGTIGICHDYQTRSPGNVRSSVTLEGSPVPTPQGTYMVYADWVKGWRDLAVRLATPNYIYARTGLKTIAQIMPVFAPVEDKNKPDKYIEAVVNLMNRWLGAVQTMQDPTNKVDIVHPNKGREGASPEILVIHVQEGANYLPDFFRSSGDDSTMWCKQDGTLIRMQQDSDSAWTNGSMTEPIDHNNPIIQNLYNRGVRNSNNYALTIENQGLASQGFTDAQVEANAKMCAYWMQKYGWTDVDTRIVGHFQIGEHKLCPGSKYPWTKLRARVKELLGGIDKVSNENQTPKPAALPYSVTVDPAGALIFPGNIPLNYGFKTAFLTLFGNVEQGELAGALMRGVKIFGLPVAPEVASETGSTQDFELAIFRFDKTEKPDWQVRLYRPKAA